MDHVMHNRRALLRFLTASPLISATFPWEQAMAATAADALDVFDLEAAAKAVVPPAHWGYLQSGVDGDATLRANQAAFGHWGLRPRRFVDVSHIDYSIEVLGAKMASPVMISPI